MFIEDTGFFYADDPSQCRPGGVSAAQMEPPSHLTANTTTLSIKQVRSNLENMTSGEVTEL